MLTAANVAAQLGLSKRKVYDLFARGELGGCKFGSSVRFEQVDVDAYMERCRRWPSPTTGATSAIASSSTALFRAAGTDIANCFQQAGVKLKLTRTTERSPRNSTQSQPEYSDATL